MILAVCADKGAPGVTTLATALGVVWPGERVLMEADPSGGDLPFRVRQAATGELLAPEPTVLSLAADARTGLAPAALGRYAHDTTLGVPVVPGALSAEAYVPARGLWPAVADVAAGWDGVAIADVGRLQPGNAALPLVRAAAAVLLLTRADVEGLYHLRNRAAELARLLGDPDRPRNPLAVVLRAPVKRRREAMADATQVLQSAGLPVVVAGAVADDPRGEALLRDGAANRRLSGSALMRSSRDLVQWLIASWPELLPPEAVAPLSDAGSTGWVPASPAAGAGPRDGDGPRR